MTELPTPISDQDKLLSNIAIGTPDIEDLIPNSRQEIYLKYIAMNGTQGTYESPVAIENGGTGATNAEEARINLGIGSTNYLQLAESTKYVFKVGVADDPGFLWIDIVDKSNGSVLNNVVIGADGSISGKGIDNRSVCLYSNGNGTTGTVTLSDSVYNYKYIEIFFRNHNYFYDSIRIAMGSEQKLFNITVHNPQENFLYIDSRTVLVSDKSITEVHKVHAGIENSTTYTNSGGGIAINRVMGYKF